MCISLIMSGHAPNVTTDGVLPDLDQSTTELRVWGNITSQRCCVEFRSGGRGGKLMDQFLHPPGKQQRDKWTQMPIRLHNAGPSPGWALPWLVPHLVGPSPCWSLPWLGCPSGLLTTPDQSLTLGELPFQADSSACLMVWWFCTGLGLRLVVTMCLRNFAARSLLIAVSPMLRTGCLRRSVQLGFSPTQVMLADRSCSDGPQWACWWLHFPHTCRFGGWEKLNLRSYLITGACHTGITLSELSTDARG